MNRLLAVIRWSVSMAAAAAFVVSAQPQMQAHPSIPMQAQVQASKPIEQRNGLNALTVIHLQKPATPEVSARMAQLQKAQVKAVAHKSVKPSFTTPDQIVAALGALTPGAQIYAGQPLMLGVTQSTANAYFRAAITGGSGNGSTDYESAFFPDYPEYGWRAGNAELYGPGSVSIFLTFGSMASRLIVDCAATGFYGSPVVDVYSVDDYGFHDAAGPFPIPQSGHLSLVLNRADAPSQQVMIRFDNGGGDFNGCQFTPIK